MTEQNTPTIELSRRALLQATGLAAGAGLLGTQATGNVRAHANIHPEYANFRVLEASKVWARGYRGRADRAIGLTDSGIDARHPDIGPWNGVLALVRDGELKLTRPAENDLTEHTLDGETYEYTGTLATGTFVTPTTATHEFTTPALPDEANELEIDATMTWEPENQDADVTSAGEDLELYLDKQQADGSWQRVASSTNAGQPEEILEIVEPEAVYRFVVESYINVIADYTIAGGYVYTTGEMTTYPASSSVAFADVDADDVTSTMPKVVGWYDAGTRYGSLDKPRDPDGHGSHCSSIMGGSGRASAVDATTVVKEEPNAVLTAGDFLEYSVPAEAGTGVFISAYGEAIELIIEGPNGEELDSSEVGSDTSLVDNNVAEAPVTESGTYTCYVRPAGGEAASTGTVDSVRVGAFLAPDETVADRLETGDLSLHAGLAPNASLVGLQGLSGPTVDLGTHAESFASTFNMRAVNMSWGYVGGLPLGAAGGFLDDIPASIKQIAEGGILTLAAAGNAATPANGNGAPGIADEAVSVAATGPRDGLVAYSSGGVGGVDEDDDSVYMKPDVTAPGGSLTDLANAAEALSSDIEDDDADVRDYTGKAGTSMAAPYVTGTTGLVAEAMESTEAPTAIRLPEPAQTKFDDVMRLKQVLLATATETAFTAAPYHRAHVPTYEFGGRDPYEGFGRVNPDAAVDAVTCPLTDKGAEVVGLNVPEDSRAVAGHLTEPGVYTVDLSFSHYAGGNKGMAEENPHFDLFVYDAANPAANGEPNVVTKAQGLTGDASVSFTLESGVYYVVAKLVNVPGAVNGYDVQAHFDLDTTRTELPFSVTGTRSDDGSVFTGGQTNQLDIELSDADGPMYVRDVVPGAWTVDTEYGDVVSVEQGDGVQYVYLTGTSGDGVESLAATYFAEAPASLEESNVYTFGDVEVLPVDRDVYAGDGWVAVAGTSDDNTVLGQST
ncbi:S8 family serine peptidase [Haladaptatus sp. YSMS36]|uniref:S8 family serine peptidase n=1 Tax=Haladaptatus sp. YSMS36 TaxID=3033384 RepID=UPI0023E86414|nr:S8 family serine peptidase [Haladaptatus sp. YSMS36]